MRPLGATKLERSESQIVSDLRNSLEKNGNKVSSFYASDSIKKSLEEIARLPEIKLIDADLAEKIIKNLNFDERYFGASEPDDGIKLIETLSQICQKLGENQPNYEGVLEEIAPWKPGNFLVAWLIDKAEKISSPETSKKLIEYALLHNRQNEGGRLFAEKVSVIVKKSTNKILNPENFFGRIWDKNGLLALLEQVEVAGIKTSEIANHILWVASNANAVEIIDLLENRLAESVELDFNKALWCAIANESADMIDPLLNRGADLESAINELILDKSYSSYFLPEVIKNLTKLEIINQVSADLVEKLIKVEMAFDAESMSALSQKLGENQPNYERVLNELQPWEYYDQRIIWLIDKVEQISSPQITQDLIKYLQQSFFYQDLLPKVMQKSIHKIPNLEMFLGSFSDQNALVSILNQVEAEIADPKIADHILQVATKENNIELIELLESKLSPSLHLNHDPALILAISYEKFEVMNALLNRGAVINQAFDVLLQNPEQFQCQGIYLKKFLKNVAKTQLVEQIKPELVERIIKSIGAYEDDDHSEILEQICQRLGDNQPNYERVLEELKPWGKFDGRIIWLVGKVDKISSLETAESLIAYLNDNLAQSQISAVIEKSANKIPNLQRFLHNIGDNKVAQVILNQMEGMLDDEETIKKVLKVAVWKGDIGLIELLEKKSATRLDYNSSFFSAIELRNLDVINFFLDRGADPNLVDKGYDYSNPVHVIEHVMCSFSKDPEVKNQLINNLLKRGANPSLVINEYRRQEIISFLQKQQNYPQLEKFLPKFMNEFLKEAFSCDDQIMMKMLINHGLNINAKYDCESLGYSTFNEDPNTYLLTFAGELRNNKIVKLLAELHAEVGDYPVVAKMVLQNNNVALKALCDNGYDCDKTFPKSNGNDYYGDKHPLVLAAYENNIDGALILAEAMTSDQLNNIDKNANLLSNLSSEELCIFLIDKGLKVDPEKEKYLLINKCKKNALELVKKLVENGYDPNAELLERESFGEKSFTSPIRSAIGNKAYDVTKYLLQQNVEIKNDILLLAVNLDNEIDVIKEIVARRPDIVFQTDFNGDSPLNFAAATGNKEVFDFLIQNGSSPLTCNNEGNNAYYQALYNDKNEDLEIPAEQFPFDLGVFDELAEYIRSRPEIKSTSAEYVAKKSGEYAAKFAFLFDDVSQLESYIEKHKGESWQILHDLTLFEFPQEQVINKEVWSNLAMEHGPQLTKYLFLANAIESNLGRSPADLAEVKKEAAKIKYPRASENPEMAEIFYKNVIPERFFNKTLDSYHTKTEDHIPDILIEGSGFGQDRFYMKKLAKDDLRGFVLGNMTNCCQYIGGAGNDCAEHGMKSPYGGFYVVFKKEKDGHINNLENRIENLENASDEKAFLQKLPDKASRTKYRKIIADIKENLQYQNGNEPEFLEIKQVLKEGFLKELEGEVIAQSWVWISKDNALVFDSWERLRGEDDKLLKPFLKKIAENVLVDNPEIKKITIGSGGYTPRSFALGKVSNPEVLADYNGYRDSEEQFLVAQRTKENGIKFNEALFINDERIEELSNYNNYSEELNRVVKIQETWRKHLKTKKESQEEKIGLTR